MNFDAYGRPVAPRVCGVCGKNLDAGPTASSFPMVYSVFLPNLDEPFKNDEVGWACSQEHHDQLRAKFTADRATAAIFERALERALRKVLADVGRQVLPPTLGRRIS